MNLVKTYKEFTFSEQRSHKLRNALKTSLITALSFNKSISRTNNWIRFPYYHHVFDDEVKGFKRQLKYLRNFGEFISIDFAVQLINQNLKIDGRYFCLSFDDGYRCCYENMMPVTVALNVPVIIYLPTDFINLSENNSDDLLRIKNNLQNNPKLLSFLSWEQCIEMLKHQICFGSHTKSHARLIKLSNDNIENELLESKDIIEQHLNTSCLHFAAPWGRPNIDYNVALTLEHLQISRYKTLATTVRGKMLPGDNLYAIKRDHILANWGNNILRYFFSS